MGDFRALRRAWWCFVCIVAVVGIPARGQSELPRFEVGASFTSVHYQHPLDTSDQSGFGGSFSWNIRRYVALDTSLNFFPSRPPGRTSQAGGRVLEGLFGARAGLRREHYGIYGKIRPGFFSYGDVIKQVTLTPTSEQTVAGRETNVALDFGGVAELYATRHWAARFDLGDTLVFFPTRTLLVNLTGTPATLTSPAFHMHNFQVATGIVFRF
jgi:hypothetical protein